MKQANLLSLLSAHKNLSTEIFKSYLNYFSIEMKDSEIIDLRYLVSDLRVLSKEIFLYDNFFIGYKIPQIGKEFDLLRIDDNSIVNIELKRESTPEKIKKQLLRNKYYLSFLKRESHHFTYVSSERKLYGLDNEYNIVQLSLKQLLAVLIPQQLTTISNFDNLFNPSDYLISPFNSTDEFMQGKYFLTNHQEKIKREVLQLIDSPSFSILSIKGKAGTGKTLLTYDIAKQVSLDNEVLVVHCGYLNKGQFKLRNDYLWDIIAAKDLRHKDLTKYKLIIIDEAQRIYQNQLNDLVDMITKSSMSCIFSYDGQQTLKRGEINSNLEAKIEDMVTTPPFELTTKIRTNKEVASFIQCLFDAGRQILRTEYSNIDVNYFATHKTAKSYLRFLKENGWKIINYTPSTVHTLPYEEHQIIEEQDNAHTVIGQEYDKVVAVVDEYFYYKDNQLSTRQYKARPFYHPTKMLFQIVSRTRLKLNVIVINNPEILNRCLEITNK